MLNILLLVGCMIHTKQHVKYIPFGVVDRVEAGLCVVEIGDSTIHIDSKTCKDGDIIMIGRQNESR